MSRTGQQLDRIYDFSIFQGILWAVLWSSVSFIVAILGVVLILLGIVIIIKGAVADGFLSAIIGLFVVLLAFVFSRQAKESWERVDRLRGELINLETRGEDIRLALQTDDETFKVAICRKYYGPLAELEEIPKSPFTKQSSQKNKKSSLSELATIFLPSDIISRSHLNLDTYQTVTKGGIRMAIEQDALRVAEFLQTLNEKVITEPEFRRLYGDMGRMDQTITRLAAALTTNFQGLENARANLILYPNRRRYQEDVDDYSQGLSATTLEIENTWRQFRANTLTSTTSLILRVEEETAKQLDQPASAVTEDATAVEGTQTVTASAKSSWLKTALNGLNQFKDFLTVAVNIDKAVNQSTPVLMESVKSALDQLEHLHF